MTKVVFLDRDGVINEFPGRGSYITKVKNFHFIEGALTAIRQLTEAGVVVFVVSNQQGVGKGIYSKDKLRRITKKMLQGVKNSGGKIKKVFYCTHLVAEGCSCRKPGVDSIERGLKLVNQTLHDAKKAYFVGDALSDIQAGKNAGCKTIFVLSGRSNRRDVRQANIDPDHISKDLLAATKIILAS